VKRNLAEICQKAGKPSAVVRVACRELESWYFGELTAVEQALCIPNLKVQARKAKYRVPDAIDTPSRELERITKEAYQKIAGSREIGKCLTPDPSQNSSVSFGHFITGLRKALASISTFESQGTEEPLLPE
jgi:hypothetical protein